MFAIELNLHSHDAEGESYYRTTIQNVLVESVPRIGEFVHVEGAGGYVAEFTVNAVYHALQTDTDDVSTMAITVNATIPTTDWINAKGLK